MLALLKRYRELLLVAVLVLFPLAVFFAHAKRPAERSRVDQLILSATAPIEKILSLTITGTLDAWHGYLGLRGAHQRAMAISQENNRLKLELQELQQERGENDRLRKLIALAEAEPRRSYLGARVIGVRLAPAGLQLVTIDKGTDDGLSRAMPW